MCECFFRSRKLVYFGETNSKAMLVPITVLQSVRRTLLKHFYIIKWTGFGGVS